MKERYIRTADDTKIHIYTGENRYPLLTRCGKTVEGENGSLNVWALRESPNYVRQSNWEPDAKWCAECLADCYASYGKDVPTDVFNI